MRVGNTEPTTLASLGQNAQCAVVPGQAGNSTSGFVVSCTTMLTGRYLSIQLGNPGGVLTLCEVEVAATGVLLADAELRD